VDIKAHKFVAVTGSRIDAPDITRQSGRANRYREYAKQTGLFWTLAEKHREIPMSRFLRTLVFVSASLENGSLNACAHDCAKIRD
jgi:hypothetical protein